MGTALLALWWAATAAAQAPYLPQSPTPVMPDPLPCPAPPGPPAPLPVDLLSTPPLPGDTLNAWCDDLPCSQPACYVFIGAMGLKRQRMGHLPVAVFDPAGRDTGDPPAANAPEVGDLNDLVPKFNSGIRATVGYGWGSHAIEASGYYLFQNESQEVTALPGQLSSFFFNPPLGFEGNNFLWRQADEVRTSLKTTLANGEVNCRWWPEYIANYSWILGLRYLDIRERLAIVTDDDGLTVRGFAGQRDLTRVASYETRVHNRIVAGQLGLECNLPLKSCVAFTLQTKGAWGANFLETDVRLERGDGLVGRRGERTGTFFSHIYDAGFFLDWCLRDNMRLRTGYNLLWVVHVAEAAEQVSFDLSRPVGNREEDGSIFYHGPVIELQVQF
jgi:hypothetical protein